MNTMPCEHEIDGAGPWSRLRSAAILLTRLLAALLLLPPGCTTVPGLGDPASATGGIFLEVDARDGEQLRARLIRVQPSGAIEWGGGRNAMNGATTWEAPLTAAQISSLRTLLEQDGWFAGTPDGSGTPQGQFTRVMLRGPEGTQSYRIRGESPAADRLVDLLESFTRGRHDEFMKRIPATQPRMDEPDPRYDQL
jgi:hypothetical protein